MKMPLTFRRWLLIVVAIAVSTQVQADLAKPSRYEAEVRLELMNGADFPEYEFYIRYDRSYDRDEYWKKWTDTNAVVILEPGKEAAPGYAWGLFARDTAGYEYQSLVDLEHLVDEKWKPNFEYYLDQIEIESVAYGMVTFKVVSRKKIGKNGEVLEIKKGEVGIPQEFNWTMALIAMSCLLGLWVFFTLRKKAT